MTRKLFVLMLLLACVAPMVIPGPNGSPIMTLSDWIPDIPTSIEEAGRQLRSTGTRVVPLGDKTVYRWQDEKGVWHFSDEAPQGQDVHLVDVDEANLMQATQVSSTQTQATSDSVSPLSRLPLMTVSPKQLNDTMEDLDQLQETVDKRRIELDEILD